MKSTLIANLELPGNQMGVVEHVIITWSWVCSAGPPGESSDSRPSPSHIPAGSYLDLE